MLLCHYATTQNNINSKALKTFVSVPPQSSNNHDL